MAVYERIYRRYDGPITATATRFLILPKYSLQAVFKNRWMLAYFITCFSFPLWCAAVIYLSHNADFLKVIPQFELSDFLEINAEFFYMFLKVQAWFAFFLSLFIGPGLVSKDLANNGLPLYLSRPFSRTEYVIGKITVLAGLLSTVTWMVAWLLMAVHANFIGISWLFENARLVVGTFVGAWIWILTLSLMSLAVSAWVRWRPVATAGMLALLLGGSFLGGVINLLFRTELGDLLDLISLIFILWAGLLGIDIGADTSALTAGVMLALFWGILLFMLNRRIRAYEVVS